MIEQVPSCIKIGENMLFLAGVKSSYEEVWEKSSWKGKQRPDTKSLRSFDK